LTHLNVRRSHTWVASQSGQIRMLPQPSGIDPQ
jgi:hypothetical protein